MEFFERILTSLESIASSLETLAEGHAPSQDDDNTPPAQAGGDPAEAGKPTRRTALAIRREELAAAIKAAGMDLAEVEKTLKCYNVQWKSGHCDKAEMLLKGAAAPAQAGMAEEPMASAPAAKGMFMVPESHKHQMPQSLVSAGTEFMTMFGLNMLNSICKDHYGVESLGLIPAEHYAAAEALMRSRMTPKTAAPAADAWETPPAATAAPVADAWETPPAAPAAAPIERDTVRKTCAAHAKAVNPEATHAILVKFGKAAKLDDVAEADLQAMYDALQAGIKAAGTAAS